MRLKTVLLSGDTRSVTSSLVEANVGIAMGSGTDVARESTGVVLIGSDLSNTKASGFVSDHCYEGDGRSIETIWE